ncbi:unnamed protein product [Caenorhabditis auriculariae]|uniref:Protein kinase domain-containing protein n=1 Tax=Caenorhabditis auriculariae TaxID=2777116 RepID=A0A8S1GTJ5_9PELO|nr:unnamed protein product [Caenorhabditis auriculariae]
MPPRKCGKLADITSHYLNTTQAAPKKQTKGGKSLNATLPATRRSRKSSPSRRSPEEGFTIVDHMKFADAFEKRKKLDYLPSKEVQDSTKQCKYIYSIKWRSGKQEWLMEKDVTSNSRLLAYKQSKGLPARHEVTYRRFLWNDSDSGAEEEDSPSDTTTTNITLRGKRNPLKQLNQTEQCLKPPKNNAKANVTFAVPEVPKGKKPTAKPKIQAVQKEPAVEPLKVTPVKRNFEPEAVEPSEEPKAKLRRRVEVAQCRVLDKLGSGSQADVYKVEYLRNGVEYAVKVFNKETEMRKILDESVLLRNLNHPNILEFLEEDCWARDLVHIIELADCSLYDEINQGISFDFPAASRLCGDILRALTYLHEKSGVHRDVKPENILRVKDVYKLADFGIYTQGSSTSKVGTDLYMAPEVDGNSNYGSKVDCYGFGVVLAEVLSTKFLQSGADLTEFNEKIDSFAARDLIALLTEANPNFRISAKGALSHPFIVEKGSNGLDHYKVAKIKIQIGDKIKDTTVLYQMHEVVAQVRRRLTHMWMPKNPENMWLTITNRKHKEVLRRAEICCDSRNFQVAIADFNIKVLYQRITMPNVKNDDEKDMAMPVRVRYLSWGTVPKLVYLVNDMSVRELIDVLLKDFEIPKELHSEFRLLCAERDRNNRVKQEFLYDESRCRTAYIDEHKYLMLYRKDENNVTLNETVAVKSKS